MKGTTTVSVVADDPGLPGREDASEVPAFVIAWSADEPERAGEITFAPPLGDTRVLGRGDDGAGDRARFQRQRPDRLDETAPLEGRALSRRQLSLRRFVGGIEIERIGRCPLLVNGEKTDKAAVTAGDTVFLKGQLLLLCTSRPRRMMPARHFPVDAWGAFGDPDALGMLGESARMWRLRDQIGFAAMSGTHVLLHGDSGTGKELAARAIHRLSPRAQRALVARNAATFPSGLIDAELFGNVKNYPNPGMPERPGLVGQAHGGTLFLDEIGELPQDMQAHLLRVLDEGGEYQRLGEASARRSDLRLVGATNRETSTMKHDLLARLAVRVDLPKLDDRREDIPILLRHLLLRAAEKSPEIGSRFLFTVQGRTEARFEGAFVEALLRRSFATNVRELDAALWQAMGASPGETVVHVADAPAPAGPAPAPGPPPATARTAPRPDPSVAEIKDAMAAANSNVTSASRLLGVSRYAMYRLLNKHGIPYTRD